MLALDEVIPYLNDAGLLARRTRSPAHVRDVSRRNLVFIAVLDDVGYVVKQPDDRDHDDLAYEAAVVRQIAAAEPRLAPYLPTPVLHDPIQRVLVSRLVGDAHDLDRDYARGRFSPLLARRIGRFLALLHGLSPESVHGLAHAAATETLGRSRDPAPLELLLHMSDAGVQLLRTLQGSPELCERLATPRPPYTAAVVHSDLRPSNCVAFPRPGGRRRTRVAVVDWENARADDPHFDLGTVLGEYLHAWLWSMSIFDPSDPEQAPRSAWHRLREMHPAIRAFWAAYADTRTGPRPSPRRAVEFAAAHLVEIAFERAQLQPSLDPRSEHALTLSLNLLRRPAEAAVQVLGLPLKAVSQ